MAKTLMKFFLAIIQLSALVCECTNPIKLIIDTDGITDDARAITLALQSQLAEVIAITTVHGGINASQSAANVLRILRANNKNVPVYVGEQDALVKKGSRSTGDDTFGADGLGDVPATIPKVLPSDWIPEESESAPEALVRLTNLHDNITLVCIGPLTNIARALQLDPTFASRPKRVVVMGGNYYGIGNAASNSTAEYNFWSDPEAAQTVLAKMKSPITLVPWEAFFLEGPKYNKLVNFTTHLTFNTPLAHFLFNVTNKVRAALAKTNSPYAFIDEIAVAVAIDESVALSSMKLNAEVELINSYTRGQVVVDWLSVGYSETTSSFKAIDNLNAVWPIRTFVTSYDVRKINDWMCAATSSG